MLMQRVEQRFPSKGHIYISDTKANKVRVINKTTVEVLTLAGTGDAGYNGDGISAKSAFLNMPISIALNKDEKRLCIADIKNYRVRYVDLDSGLIKTLAGNGISAVPVNKAPAKQAAPPKRIARDTG